MRTLGIDFGQKRTGLALSDPAGRIALPYKTLHHQSRKRLVQDILQILASEKVEQLVLGLPRTQSQEDCLGARQIKNLAHSLQRASSKPVYLLDETLSTYEARQRLQGSGLKPSKVQSVLDQQAAVIILENFLQAPEQALTL